MKKIYLLQLLLIFSFFFSQKIQVRDETVNVATPEIANLMRYADFPDLDFVGKTNISIPLYTIKYEGIDIPISIDYNTKGNKVADIATIVGLGWSLNSGGSITQKVNDMDDFIDSYNYYTDSQFEPEQGYAWHRLSKGFHTIDDDQTHYNSVLQNRVWGADDINSDSAPDFYYISAPNFRDKFFLSSNRNQLSVGNLSDVSFKANFFTNIDSKLLSENLDIIQNGSSILYSKMNLDIAGSGAVNSSGTGVLSNTINKFEIVKNDGLVYNFSQVEAAYNTKSPIRFDEFYETYDPTTWLLTSISSPFTGKKIVFEYEGFVNNYEHLSLKSLGDINFGGYPVKELQTGMANTDDNYYFGGQVLHNSLNVTVLRDSKRLKKIIFDGGTVNFLYGHKRLDYAGDALTQIDVKDYNGAIIKTFNFNYAYFSTQNCYEDYLCKRLKLESIIDSESGKYSFTYGNEYISNNFPPRNSSKTDYLGFFNDNTSNYVFTKNNFHPFDNYYESSKLFFYPTLQKDQLIPFQLKNLLPYSITSGIDKSPSNKSLLGLLTRISYPTSGSLKIDYENDDFRYEDETYLLGSSRVKELTYYSKATDIAKKVKYSYLSEEGSSSGHINYFTLPSGITKTEILSGIGFNNGGEIGYSRITEEIAGKSVIEKIYSTFTDYPDVFMQLDHSRFSQATKNFIKFLKFPSSYIQSYDERRGKLIELNEFRYGELAPIFSKKYSYKYVPVDSLIIQKNVSDYDPYTHRNTGYFYYATNNLIRYYQNISQESTTEFFQNKQITTNNEFFFNKNNLIAESKKYISGSDDIIQKKYFYPFDLDLEKFINKNILDLKIKEEVYKNENKIESKIKLHNDPNNLFQTSSEYYDLYTGSTSKEITYDKYDTSNGNLLQYTLKSGIPVSIIWGYNQTQPIAKIQGASFAQVLTALNVADISLAEIVLKSNLDKETSSENDLITALDNLRVNAGLKNYQITTYTYNPLIGVTSITPPSGIREMYVYDSSNRLKEIVDVNKNLIKEYKYNYAPKVYYSENRSQTFTRSNCSSSSIGGNYNYIVPEGKYTSLISKNDADQQAQNDINANGQTAANTYGTCTSISCPLNFASPFSGGGSLSVSNNNYKISMSFGTGPSSTTMSWSTGVRVAYITGSCRPTKDYTGYNGQIYYIIKTNGDIIIRTNGSVLPNNTSYYYELTYPINY